jgi:hypothetical protein
MAQHEELARVKARIIALSNMVVERGASLQEANFAMEQVGKLLLQFNLTMDELALVDERVVTLAVGTGTQKRAQHSLYMGSVAHFCDCKVWFSRTPTEIVYNFFGIEADVQMAVYLAQVIMRALKYETNAYKKTGEYIFAPVHRKRLTNSFQNGMAERIADRLDALAASSARDRQTLGGDSTALVVASKGKRIDAEFKKMGLRLKTVTTYTRTTSSDSYRAGAEAGNRVNLHRPIRTGDKGPLLIGRSK